MTHAKSTVHKVVSAARHRFRWVTVAGTWRGQTKRWEEM